MAELDQNREHLDPDQVPMRVGASLVRTWRMACAALAVLVALLLAGGARHLGDGGLLPTRPGETPAVQATSDDPLIVSGSAAALQLPTRPAATADPRSLVSPAAAVVRIRATQPARHPLPARPAS